MRIEAFLAARIEPPTAGFAIWAALIRVDGGITWSAADCAGRPPRVTISRAQHLGAREALKRLLTLRAQNPEASLGFFADSKALVEELNITWPRSQQVSCAVLDECLDLAQSLGLPLRFISRHANFVPHQLITLLCRRHGVPVTARYVRPETANLNNGRNRT
jgi:hypothetical protein